MEGDLLKAITRKYIITNVLLTVVLLFSACSKKESTPVYPVINPSKNITVSDYLIPNPVSPIPNPVNPVSDPESPVTDLVNSVSDPESPVSDPVSPVSDPVSTVTDSDDPTATSDIPISNEPVKWVDDNITKMIAIDAGHQSKGNAEKEPVGPGATVNKAKVSTGTRGVVSGVAEYELTLIIAQMVKEELMDRGYDVFMVRETHDVNLSNKERADMVNESGADLFIRIHADSFTDSSINGVSTLYPSEDNPYVADLSSACLNLSNEILNNICKLTGAKNRGVMARDDMSGINWCNIPVSIIEMGFMSNPKEDKLMQTEKYQRKIANGICDGIDTYYEETEDE